MFLALLLAVSTALADCPALYSQIELADMLQQTETAYADLDPERFTSAADEAALVLPCVDTRIPRRLAAQHHRIQGLRGFLGNDLARAKGALDAARALDPAYEFPDALLPPGHDARVMFESAPTVVDRVPVPAPVEGELFFDGVSGALRPDGVSTIFQRVDGEGTLVATAYVHVGDPLPEYDNIPLPPERTGAFNRGWVAASGAAGAGALGLYVAAYSSKLRYNSYSADENFYDLSRLKVENGVLVLGSGVLGSAAVGAFLVAAFKGQSK